MKGLLHASLLLTLFSLIVFAMLYFSGQLSVNRDEQQQDNPETITPTPLPTTPEPTPVTIMFEEKAAPGAEHFFEKTPKLGGEQGYVAYPMKIQEDKPPAIVMYYHGSTQRITTNFSEQVMKNMREYGSFFTERNVAFLASNQHGDNFGRIVAVEDSRALIKWVQDRYPISGNVYILGFSMGGMPAMRHVVTYPKEVKKIALLAPAQQIETYSAAQIKQFSQVRLKVWHGTADVNVPYWVAEELATYFEKHSVPLELVTLKGKTHWDVDTEYMNEIYEWFFPAEVEENIVTPSP